MTPLAYNSKIIIENIKWLLIDLIAGIDLARASLAMLIFILFIVLRRFLVRMATEIIKAVIGKKRAGFIDKFFQTLQGPACFLVVTIGVWLATGVMQLTPKSALFMNRLIRSMVVFAIFWGAYSMTEIPMQLISKIKIDSFKKIDDVLYALLRKVSKVIIVAVGAIIIAQEWDYEVTSIVAGLGLGGLTFALAAKDTAASIFGSITIILDKPFTIGDWIQVGAVEGTVEEIGLRSTKVRNSSQALVSVPNSLISSSVITNLSRLAKRRIKLVLNLNPDANQTQINRCIDSLKSMLAEHPNIDADSISVNSQHIGENMYALILYFAMGPASFNNQLEIKNVIDLKIMNVLKESGLSARHMNADNY